MLIDKRRQRAILPLLGESLIFISLFSIGKMPAVGADLSGIRAYSEFSDRKQEVRSQEAEVGDGAYKGANRIRPTAPPQGLRPSSQKLAQSSQQTITRVTGVDVKQTPVGIKADLTSKLSTTLAFYDLTRSNVTTTDPTNSNFSVQTGEQSSRGIELDVGGEILPGWNIIGGYAYTDARVTEDNDIPVGNRLFSAPENSFNLWTTYRIQQSGLKGLGVGLGFNYVGETAGNLANTFEVPSFFRTDAAIFYEREQFRAAVNFRNLFDVEYYKSTGSETLVGVGEPFTVQGTISWEF
jgi:outer membrane receptor protein involved in Fe transport